MYIPLSFVPFLLYTLPYVENNRIKIPPYFRQVSDDNNYPDPCKSPPYPIHIQLVP
jgi:hypothetical protein